MKTFYSFILIFLVINSNLCLQADLPSLKEAYSKYFKFGTGILPEELNPGKSFTLHHFNSITPGNHMKPDYIIDQQASASKGNNVNPIVKFGSGTAQTIKFCEENKISLRGHTIVWHSQTPDWLFKENFSSQGKFVNKEIMDKRLENFIKNIFEAISTQYPNVDLYSYDVCNEVFLNDGGGFRGADSSNWFKVYGDESYIINAFTYARKYAPKNCKLYLNDYNEYIDAKTQNIYDMAMKLKALGVIDGIGMQAHLSTDFPSADMFRKALEKFASTGLDVQITELDITGTDESLQAERYKEIFKVAVENAEHISSVTVWGTNDQKSWRGEQKPLLFSNYEPKKQYYAVMEVVGGK